MSTIKPIPYQFTNEPSVFSLLVDDISKMSQREQQLLWMELNKEKIAKLATAMDNGTQSHNLSEDEISTIITEAGAYARKNKKG
ncbi:MAG: hypothetical protein QM610_02425 [Chitinophagaceae bacterium]